MDNQTIHAALIQPRGSAYRDSEVKSISHYREPIDTSIGRIAGRSHIWGDASPQVQSRAIDFLIASSERAGLTAHETAYVLAVARMESGFNPDAAAGPSSAYGLGQAVEATGRSYGLTQENYRDVTMQCDVLVAMYQDNAHIARIRGQGEEYIYKYHHDGPRAEAGGLVLSREGVMPYVASYENFVLGHRQAHGITPVGPSLVVRPEPGAQHPVAPLVPGSHGDAVRTLQRELNQLGYADAFGQPLTEDRNFGAGTQYAVDAFQNDHALMATGRAGPLTLAAINEQATTQNSVAYRLDHPRHPDASLYLQAQSAVQRLDAAQTRTSDQRSENLMAALTVAARRGGLTCIDHAALSDDAHKVFVIQGQPGDPFTRFASVSTLEAVNTCVAQSSAQWLQLPTHGTHSPHAASQQEVSQAATIPSQTAGVPMQH